MFEVCKIMFTLSLAQSFVERGFKVNLQFVNFQWEFERKTFNYIALGDRLYVSIRKNLLEVQITQEMLHYVKEASRKYKEELYQQPSEKENKRKSLKHETGDDEIKQMKPKYYILQNKIEDLTISTDKLVLNSFTYLEESNEKKKIYKAKKTEIEELKMIEQNLNKSLSQNVVRIAMTKYVVF